MADLLISSWSREALEGDSPRAGRWAGFRVPLVCRGPYPERIQLWQVPLPLWNHLNIPCTREICMGACFSHTQFPTRTCQAAMTRLPHQAA